MGAAKACLLQPAGLFKGGGEKKLAQKENRPQENLGWPAEEFELPSFKHGNLVMRLALQKDYCPGVWRIGWGRGERTTGRSRAKTCLFYEIFKLTDSSLLL